MDLKLPLAITVFALAGCASSLNLESDEPPKSQVRVDETYVISESTLPTVAIVLGPAAVADSGGVSRHLGGPPEAAAATFRSFFSEHVAGRLLRDAKVRAVRVPEPVDYDRAGVGPRPADGVRLAFDGFEPDLVLFLDTLHVGRTTYRSIQPAFGNVSGGVSVRANENLRLDAHIMLWDNQAGREVAAGRLETEQDMNALSGKATRGTYEDAVGEFVEQLARYTPLDLWEKGRVRRRRIPSGG